MLKNPWVRSVMRSLVLVSVNLMSCVVMAETRIGPSVKTGPLVWSIDQVAAEIGGMAQRYSDAEHRQTMDVDGGAYVALSAEIDIKKKGETSSDSSGNNSKGFIHLKATGMTVGGETEGRLESSIGMQLNLSKNIFLGIKALDMDLLGSDLAGLDGYSRVSTLVYVGYMKEIGKDKCQLTIIPEFGNSWYNSHNLGGQQMNRAELGIQSGMGCKKIEVKGKLSWEPAENSWDSWDTLDAGGSLAYFVVGSPHGNEGKKSIKIFFSFNDYVMWASHDHTNPLLIDPELTFKSGLIYNH